MAQYRYRGKDGAFAVVEGTIEAESPTAAITRLNGAGIFPLIITEGSGAVPAGRTPMRRRVARRALATVSRQLADLLHGGLPLAHALSLVAQQTEPRPMAAVIRDIAEAVRSGQPLSAALTDHPEVFSPLYVSLIKVGETGGDFDGVLYRLAELAERDEELRSRVAMALVYPLLVLGIGVITVGVVLTAVVPKLSILFAEAGQALPLPTRALLVVSHAMTRWWWAGLGGLLLVVGAARAWARSAGGRAATDRWLLRLPLVGRFARQLELSRWTRHLGVMVGHGLPVLQALEVANATLTNAALRGSLERVTSAVQDGASLSAALAERAATPLFVTHLVAVGEESGTLDDALGNVAASFEREADRRLRLLVTVLEPLLIVVVGLIVMGIVIAMLLPIFQLSLVVQ